MTNPRPRNIANDILDAVETATSKWTRQKKSEERHPGNDPLSSLAHDQRAAHDAERGCVGGDGRGLHGRERQRHAAGHRRGKSITRRVPRSWR